MSDKNQQDLSYFQLRLKEHLNYSYPELAKNNDFIVARSELASQAYTEAISTNHNHIEASHIANTTLFSDLPFSKMDMLFDIICNEFNREIKDEELHEFTEKMYPISLPLFSQYNIDKDFENSEMHMALYTELTGVIQIWIEENLIAM